MATPTTIWSFPIPPTCLTWPPSSLNCHLLLIVVTVLGLCLPKSSQEHRYLWQLPLVKSPKPNWFEGEGQSKSDSSTHVGKTCTWSSINSNRQTDGWGAWTQCWIQLFISRLQETINMNGVLRPVALSSGSLPHGEWLDTAAQQLPPWGGGGGYGGTGEPHCEGSWANSQLAALFLSSKKN